MNDERNRTIRKICRVTPEESARIDAKAKAARQSLSRYMRTRLLGEGDGGQVVALAREDRRQLFGIARDLKEAVKLGLTHNTPALGVDEIIEKIKILLK